ncbi:PF09148 domain protein [Eubacterium nodatum ATCC 33099]|nr:PF09148 domain protein [Eubacterium nodatum ATCC 33099]
MKDIMLKIIGKQFSGDEAEEQMEFVTEGKLYEKNGATYLIYEESEFSGFPGCKTSLKLKGDTIRLKRIGDGTEYGMEIEFKEGQRFSSKYDTPYGPIGMEVLTDSVTNDLSPEGYGKIGVKYQVSLGGMAEGRNELNIEVIGDQGVLSETERT